MAVLGPLAALALLLSLQGCGTTASATTTVAGPTQASALKVFNAYVTAERVALANHDQLLAESLTGSSQYTLLAAEYAIAAATGNQVTSPTYGKPTLYVPKLITYPQWFMATVPEYPPHGGHPRTALMVFDRPDAAASWTLDGTVLLRQDAPPLNVKVDQNGYATALATTDPALEFRPVEVGATHAAVVDEGPASAAASVVAAGPLTTGIYQAHVATARQVAAQGNTFGWQMEGTSYPVFALRTTDGGAIVFYTMSLNTETTPVHKPPAHPKTPPPTIPVPEAYKPLLPPDQVPITHGLDADATLQFLSIDPPPARNGGTTGKLQVVGSVGGPTYAKGI
jgi:hypothetical protein